MTSSPPTVVVTVSVTVSAVVSAAISTAVAGVVAAGIAATVYSGGGDDFLHGNNFGYIDHLLDIDDLWYADNLGNVNNFVDGDNLCLWSGICRSVADGRNTVADGGGGVGVVAAVTIVAAVAASVTGSKAVDVAALVTCLFLGIRQSHDGENDYLEC